MADDAAVCPVCATHFTTPETLSKHMAAIHPQAAPVEKQARAHADVDADAAQPDSKSENMELAPLLGVLSEAQKDALILRAVQADGLFYERIAEQAAAPLTEEAADARLDAMEAESVVNGVRWFESIGAPANALTLLIAASQRCAAALECLAERLPAAAASTGAPPEGQEGEDAGGWESSAEIAAVEALPAAGTVGALWKEMLALAPVRSLPATQNDAHEIRLMLEGLQAVAGTVRAVVPALLLGPGGEKPESLGEAMEELEKLLVAPGGPAPAGKNKKRRP